MLKLLISLIFVLTACERTEDLSKTLGHFDNMSKAQAEAIALTKPRVIAEHEHTDFVLISGALVISREYNGQGRTDLALAILKSGADLVILVSPNLTNPLAHPKYREFAFATASYRNKIQFIQSRGKMANIWARDWAPLQAINNFGQSVLLDFNYYPTRAAEDHSPQILARVSEKSTRLSVPVYNEGGNLMSNSRQVCMMTDRVVAANQKPDMYALVDTQGKVLTDQSGNYIVSTTNNLQGNAANARVARGRLYADLNDVIRIRTDDRKLTIEEIIDYYKRYSGCAEVHILPAMPLEGTGHIDMFAKFLDDDTILLNAISNEQINRTISAKERAAAIQIQAYLQNIATYIESLGYRVIKIPMPIPHLRYEQNQASAGGSATQNQPTSKYVMRSYTNSLLINRSGNRVAIVPRYTRAKMAGNQYNFRGNTARIQAYSDQNDIGAYEQAVINAYHSAGYKVIFVDSDMMITNGGAVHCVTMQFNRPL